jgi:hypothetical protein
MGNKDLPKGPPILSIDFDGVLHSYASGWKGAREIPDAPVVGAIQWLQTLVFDQRDPFAPRFDRFDVCIFSSRSRYWGGRSAMKRWLLNWGLRPGELEAIRFPLWKPPSFLHIDDRALQFVGVFPKVKDMLGFKPWYKREPQQKALRYPSFLSPSDQPVFRGFENREVVYAKDQPEYNPLRTLRSSDRQKRVLSRWQLDAEQRTRIANGEDIFLELMSFGEPLQPTRMFLAGNWPSGKLMEWWNGDAPARTEGNEAVKIGQLSH